MFCPALGIAEDPVSGNAHGLLGAYLAQLRLITRSGERAHFTGIQGHSLHRPGRVEVELEFSGEALAGVWISGQAVSIFETEIRGFSNAMSQFEVALTLRRGGAGEAGKVRALAAARD